MTPQEQQLIDGLVERIRSTQVTDKDVTAEQHLQQGLAGYPDATYVMAQTIIVQQYGLQQAQSQLEQAQAQIADLKGQLDELRQHAATTPGTGGSFLSHLFGGNSPQASPANPPYQPVNNPGYGAGSQNYPPAGYPPAGYPPAAYPPAYAQPSSYAPAGGGFLRGALQTAAGVAAGEMAFASIESLFHGFGGGGGYGSGFGGGGFGEGRPEEVINNYYGDGTEHHGDHLADTSQDSGGSHNDGFGNDTSSNQFADTQDSNANAFGDTDTNDQNYTGDDSTYDDSNFNDSSSDDSGDSSDFGGDDQS